ncbi:hypothetical protein GWP57_07070 [Gammaproteobacteria bacterium]|jgi:uncharacterized protein (DUF302 family)|nr:hypothetical protein [Gammaproteobacteria bacterium]
MRKAAAVAMAALAMFLASPSQSADDIGIFETIRQSSISFAATAEVIEAALTDSGLKLHASHDVRVPEDAHKARIYILTAPAYVAAAAAESPRTISAQVLRIAVFTTGDEQTPFINMANPVAHAMVYYADSPNYDTLVGAAGDVAQQIRELVATVPGTAINEQAEPRRSENHYRKYKGDGPARMMAKFRKWEKSQLPVLTDTADNFSAVADQVVARLSEGVVADAEEAAGWEVLVSIPVRPDAVYIGLSNPYIEDKMVGINSRFRNEGKSELSPYPGVDHVAALPTEVLIVREGDETVVLHYGQMWRMQLYFWDSGYRAFTANVGVPGTIVNSIEAAIKTDR